MSALSFSHLDQSTLQAYRASVLHFSADPGHHSDAYHWHEDGLLLIADGKVVAAGDYQQLSVQLKAELKGELKIQDYRGKIIMPGFIDTHLHYPQTDMIASPAPGLLP